MKTIVFSRTSLQTYRVFVSVCVTELLYMPVCIFLLFVSLSWPNSVFFC